MEPVNSIEYNGYTIEIHLDDAPNDPTEFPELYDGNTELQSKDSSFYNAGQVYGYVVLDANNQLVRTCWGFYGPVEESGIIEHAKSDIDKLS